MHTLSRVLGVVGLSSLLALGACASAKPAAAPTEDAANPQRVGSPEPDPATVTTPSTPATETAAASKTDDGSDIIPPFTGGAKASKKSGASSKPPKSKKSGGRAKPKG